MAACGTIALIYSLFLNRAATNAAIESANAARETVRAGRAWLSFDKISGGTFTNSTLRNDDGDKHVSVGLVFEFSVSNVGQTPAQHARLFNSYRLIDPGTDIPEFNISIPDDYCGATISVGLGLKAVIMLDDEQSANVADGSKRLIMYAKAVYFDMFSNIEKIEERRITEFCIEALHRRGYEFRPDGSRVPKIDFASVGKQNSQT